MRKFFTIFLMSVLFVGLVSAQGGRKDLSILLVHDDNSSLSITDSIRNAITAAGYTFTDYNAVANGAPAVDVLTPYELVVWTTGNAWNATTFWEGSLPSAGIKAYLDNGGMLFLEGINNIGMGGFGDRPVTFSAGDFSYDYLGVSEYTAQAKSDDDGVGLPMMVVVEDNGICTTDTAMWTSNMMFADIVTPTSTAKSIYNAGPADYAFAGKSSMVYNEIGNAKILSAHIRWDYFKTAELRDDITEEILNYFDQFAELKGPVESIEITTLETSFVITENNGSLQVSATVLPADANNRTVTYSIGEGSVAATITKDGLITASGFDSQNGVVHIIATANDGSGISATQDVTISGQTLGAGFKVLLVNDDARDLTRYMDIDTALVSGGYNYKFYNAAVEGTIPDFDYLANFDFVLWYNARDGVSLKFWDVSDSSDFKCNAPLKQYVDNGGTVWVQGRDLLYDIWGGTYTAKNEAGDSVIAAYEAGDFAYDYLGLASYVAQSHVNETSGVFDGVEQFDITEENTMTTLDPIKSVYSSMHYADALDVTENAVPLYYMGPETYDFSLYYAMVQNTVGNGEFLFTAFDPSKLDNQENLNQYITEVIDNYVTGISSKEFNNFEMNVYPNPANNQVSINYSFNNIEKVTIQVTDLSGKIILSESVYSSIGDQTRVIDVSNISSGLYNITVSSSVMRSNKRLVIVR